MKDIDDYQHLATEFALFINKFYPKVSLVIEAAELCDLFVKHELRGDPEQASREDIISEAGDVLWNLAVLLDRQDILMSEVAEYNIEKLTSRKDRGVIQGSGGNR